MRIRLKENEEIIKKGLANSIVNNKKEGGRLYLTNLRLYFVPYKVDNTKRPIEIPVSEIEDVDLVKAKGIISKGLIIFSKTGESIEFFLYGRSKWAKCITELID